MSTRGPIRPTPSPPLSTVGADPSTTNQPESIRPPQSPVPDENLESPQPLPPPPPTPRGSAPTAVRPERPAPSLRTDSTPSPSSIVGRALEAAKRSIHRKDVERLYTQWSSTAAGQNLSAEAQQVFTAALYAVGLPRMGESSQGKEAILPSRTALRALECFSSLPQASQEILADLLAQSASPFEASLILKAMAARTGDLENSGGTARHNAVEALCTFAQAIRGLEPTRLMQQTTLLDIDERHSTLDFDPISLDREDTRNHSTVDSAQRHNDGLYQRYENSCGPTSIEILLGELDPIYAFTRRSEGFNLDPAHTADLQKEILERYGEDTSSRVIPPHVRRLRTQLTHMRNTDQMSEEVFRATAQYILGDAAPSADSGAGLSLLRAQNDGYPQDAVISSIRAYQRPDPAQRFNRIGLQNIRRLLNHHVGSKGNINYQLHSVYQNQNDERAPAIRSSEFVRQQLGPLAENLRSGIDVIFGTSRPDHFWSMSAVKGEAGNLEFLVHDPWSGTTRWVHQRALEDGTFATTFLGESDRRTFVDLFYLANDN